MRSTRSFPLVTLSLSLVALTAGCGERPASQVQAPAETSLPGETPGAAVPPPAARPAAAAAKPAPAAPAPNSEPLTPAGKPVAAMTPLPEPPKPAGTPMTVPADGVRLAFKFNPGQESKYDVTLQQEMNMVPPTAPGTEGGGMQPGGIKTVVEANLQFVHDFKAGKAGAAEVMSRADNGSLRVNNPMMGEFSVELKDGKATSMANGQPQASGGGQGDSMLTALATRKAQMTIAPTGKVLASTTEMPSASGATAMLAGGVGTRQVSGGYGLLVLPDRPVRPGDSWSDTVSEPLPALGKGQKPVKAITTTKYTLKEILDQGGRKIAVIDSVTSTKLDKNAFKGQATNVKVEHFTNSISGTTQFDVDAGAVLLGHYKLENTADFSTVVPQAKVAGADGKPGRPASMKMSMSGAGTLQVKRVGAP